MNGLLGRGLILVALSAASFGLVLGMVAGARQSLRGLRLAQAAAHLFSVALVVANLVMVRALLQHDFSVSYVAKVGSLASPTWVTVVSLWSSLEGSILFWGAVLGIYVSLFAWIYRDRYREYMPYALAVMLGVGVFFCLLLAGPASPFEPVVPPPPDGPGPNPLLQNHLLMVVHPPALYLGYVGMTIPFAIAMAAVLRGKLSEGWLKPLRRWTLIPWLFLTIGIVLGGWWAYEVLGWGGYWAWDPVENASFLPWLAATGYLHSTIVHERRRILKMWTMSLVIVAFLLTLLGTFMTRSGVFNSVHAFSQSSIGPAFLIFIAIATIFSLGALTGRGHLLQNEGKLEAAASREVAFVANNLLLVTFTFTVLLGTVYPLITEAVRGVKVSVGEPYFNQMAVPLGLMLVFLMGIGPSLPWGRADLRAVLTSLLPPLAAGVLVAGICAAFGAREILPLVTFAACGFAGFVTLREGLGPILRRPGNPLRAIAAHRRRVGGHLVHAAVIIMVAAIAASHAYKQTAEASLRPGQSIRVGDYTMTLRQVGQRPEPHRRSVFALVDMSKGDRSLGLMEPKLNFYPMQREPIGTPHVRTVGSTDLYLTLMAFEPDGTSATLKIFINPMVPWIWRALPLFALGSVVAIWPRRRTRLAQAPDGATVPAP